MTGPEARTKENRRELIPEELLAALREALLIIEEAAADAELVIDFEDAIEMDGLVGGEIGDDSAPFHFTYSPPADEQRGRWFLRFDKTQLEAIAAGECKALAVYCCTASDCRCKFTFSGGLCGHCDLKDEPDVMSLARKLMEAAPGLGGLLGGDSGSRDVASDSNSEKFEDEEFNDDDFENDEDDDFESYASATPEDEAPEEIPVESVARQMIDELIADGKLELTTPSSLTPLIQKLADFLARDPNIEAVAEWLEEADGVAELYAADDELLAAASAADPTRSWK